MRLLFGGLDKGNVDLASGQWRDQLREGSALVIDHLAGHQDRFRRTWRTRRAEAG